jgi:2-amino-4-hydroxy-6-hydroxymethyldihydropteridine diphosphokinase
MQYSDVYFLLGANLGDRATQLQQATQLLIAKVGPLLRQSAMYETAPWGNTNQPGFLNQVVVLRTRQHPIDLLRHIRDIEQALGRVRHEKWGSRVIDVDILYYGALVVKMPDLSIPHPYIAERRFTLIPLVEIAADFVHPVLKLTQNQLLGQCPDQSAVVKLPTQTDTF